MPLKKTPSNVPSPPILATGAPSFGILGRLSKSAPINAPSTPETYAMTIAEPGARTIAVTAAAIGGINAGGNYAHSLHWSCNQMSNESNDCNAYEAVEHYREGCFARR
jgi:hypothetical protein